MNETPDYDPRSTDWLDVLGKRDLALAGDLQGRMRRRMEAGEFTIHDLRFVRILQLNLFRGRVELSHDNFEMLRRLCLSWNIGLRPLEIKSHRKYIGPIIVACKKAFFRVLQVLLKDLILQQRAFNANAITLLARLSAEQQASDEEKASS
jgi:hypothetical protein